MLRKLVHADSADGRQGAFALACQFGHAEVVRLLLPYGVAVRGFNPAPFHPHATPLHQAAVGGHDQVVRLLLEQGAAVDVRDRIWKATPAEWAEYGGHAGIAELLGGAAA